MTRVTAATGTVPPGTVSLLLYAPQVEIQRPSTWKPKHALRLENLVHGRPAVRDVIVVKAAHARSEEFVGPLRCGVHQVALGQVRSG